MELRGTGWVGFQSSADALVGHSGLAGRPRESSADRKGD